MTRPIPVFEFVIAAYAATCAGRDFRSRAPGRDVAPLRAFAVDGARLMSTADISAGLNGLMVKVSIADSGATSSPQDSGKLPAGPVEELWLGGIVETSSGFLGVVCFQPERLPHVRAGDVIAFRRDHVLEWKQVEPASHDAADATPANGEPPRPAAEAALI